MGNLKPCNMIGQGTVFFIQKKKSTKIKKKKKSIQVE